jgi:membrane-anchored protein YejM (alkaline phosphatase superfamily)
LPDRRYRSTTSPLLFQYARAMNYETHLFDGGARQPRFGIDFDDLEVIGDWGTRDRFGNDPDTDFRIAREVASLLDRAAGQFIVILKRGNHAPYERNYPAASAMWMPDSLQPADAGLEDAQVINSYDNALRFNVDRFLQIVTAARGFDRTVLLYTSDHGQLLTDSRRGAMSRELAWGEVAVPLLMMGPARPAADTGYAASHANVAATVLDLLEAPDAIRDTGMGRSLFEAAQEDRDPRQVFNGAFSGIGSYGLQDFDEMAAER